MKHNSYANVSSVKSRRVVRADLPPNATTVNATEPTSPTKPRRVSARDLAPKATIVKKPRSPTKRRVISSRDLAPEARKSSSPAPVTITTSIAALQTPPSPRRAARTAMLKARFAGTIAKAQKQLFGDRKEMIVPIPATTKKPTTEELRELARKASETMERTVELDDSHKSVRDLQRLCGWPIPYVGGFLNRMHYLGLYLKN